MYSDLRLRTKMMAGFLFVALLSGVIGMVSLRAMQKMAQADQRLYEDATVPLPDLSDIGVTFQRLRVASRDFINAQGDAAQRAKFQGQINDLEAEVTKVSDGFERRNLSPEMRTEFGKFKEARKAYEAYLAQIVAMAQANKDKEAWGILWSEGYNSEVGSELNAINRMEELKVQEAKKASDDNAALASASTSQMTVTIVIGFVLAIGIGLWLTSSIVSPLKQTAQSLAVSSEELSAVSHQMSTNAEETSSQANVVSAAAEQTTRNLQTVATATEEMTASIREIAKNSVEAARIATTAMKAAANTNTTVSKLGESSAEVGQVVKVITSIAQQTNLLALNATIEAARAGEAGKGFAVVANEVKELAKETARATEVISQKIDLIQGNTGQAIEMIREISGIITQVNDISNTIASAVEEQTATTNEIARNVAEAARGSSQVAENMTSVAQAAKSTATGASHTQSAAGDLSKMASEIQRLVTGLNHNGTWTGSRKSVFPVKEGAKAGETL